ncbi:GNAT family N-acetyltransferase [Aliikangiella sp. G2MR2-5]|uniref:GNAT family N-acetyltransferase n=1 Tax=Aliikangiella sp. G2MR2-5 TaxID=2788943 RepID=UPI0018A8F442
MKSYFGTDGLMEIADSWQQLFESLRTPVYSQSPYWFQQYIQYLEKSPQSWVWFCVYSKEKLIALLPLQERSLKLGGLNVKYLTFSSHSHFGLKSFIFGEDIDSSKVVRSFLKYIRSDRWTFLDLHGVEKPGASYQSIVKQSAIIYIERDERVVDILLIGDMDGYLSSLSKSFRRNLKRVSRKIESKSVEYEFNHQCALVKEAFSRFLLVEASGWKGLNGTRSAIGLHKNLTQFYHSLVSALRFNDESMVEINIMKIDGKDAAVQYAICIEKTVFLLKIGYDEFFSSFQPGNLLLLESIHHFHKRGFEQIHLITDAKWHNSWRPGRIETKRMIIGTSSMFNILVFNLLKVALKVKSLLHRT